MRIPRKRTAGIALLLVVITIGLTSPLLTMFSTLLQPREAADYVLSSQLISLLGGHWGNSILQTEIAISASALLIFASNTAIIGAYHVFIALARLGFFPEFVMKRNKLRNTPHNAIILATSIPIFILILVLGNIVILGDMYAFGLLGAFTLTCLGLDIVRSRDRKAGEGLRQRRNALSSLVTNDVSVLRFPGNHLPGNEITDCEQASFCPGVVLPNVSKPGGAHWISGSVFSQLPLSSWPGELTWLPSHLLRHLAVR